MKVVKRSLAIILVLVLFINGCGEDNPICPQHDDKVWQFTDLTFSVEPMKITNLVRPEDHQYVLKSNELYDGDVLIFRLGEKFTMNDDFELKDCRGPLTRDVNFLVELLCKNKKINGSQLFEVESVYMIGIETGSTSQWKCAENFRRITLQADLKKID